MTKMLDFIYWQPDEIAFHVGSYGVRWYGLCWLTGLTLGFFLMQWLYKKHKYPDEKFEPLFLYVFIGVLVGARLGHCIFYQPDYFLTSGKHFVEMFLPIKFLDGGGWKFIGYEGLASHGGVAGMLVGLYMYIRKYKMPAWVVLDFMGICSGITATFIRLGNLMNSEIIGKQTDVPWAFIFANVDQAPRHPGQLYESLFYLFTLHRDPAHLPQASREAWERILLRTLSDDDLHASVSSSNIRKKFRKLSRPDSPSTWDKSSVFRSLPWAFGLWLQAKRG